MHRHKQHQLHKTKYIGYAATSIDGRISLDSKKLPDWTSPEDWKMFQAALAKVDAVVAGRNTYLVAKARLDKRRTFVLTSTVTKPRTKGSVTFVNPKHTDLGALFAEFKKVAIVGGAEAYQSMLLAGLFDELYLTIEPVLFGRGRELFAGGKKNTPCTLLSAKKLNARGTLLLRYKIDRK